MGEFDPSDRPDYMYALNTDPWVQQDSSAAGGKLQPADVRATPLACIGTPIAVVVLVALLVLQQWVAAIVVVVLGLVLNFWAASRGMRDRSRNNKSLASIDAVTGIGDVHIAAPGQGPEDGFTGYEPVGDVARWGDYTAAVADGDTVWFATEYIAHPPTNPTTRTLQANWATFVGHVTP